MQYNSSSNARAGKSYVNQSKTPTQMAMNKFASEIEDQTQKKEGSRLLPEDLTFSQFLKIVQSLLDRADSLESFPRATTFSSWGQPSTLSLYSVITAKPLFCLTTKQVSGGGTGLLKGTQQIINI